MPKFAVELEVEMFVSIEVSAETAEEAMDIAEAVASIQEYQTSIGVDIEEGRRAELIEVYSGTCTAERWEVLRDQSTN